MPLELNGLTAFAIATRGRTGSTALVGDLDQHPDILCHQEILRSIGAAESSIDRDCTSLLSYRASNPEATAEEYFNLLIAQSMRPGLKALGMKVLLNHFEGHGSIKPLEFMVENGFRFIYLVRNSVNEAVSGAIAAKRGAYNLQLSQATPELRAKLLRPVELDPQPLVKSVKMANHWRTKFGERLTGLNANFITVTYEDYVSRKMETLNGIYAFLGVAPSTEDPEVRWTKMTSASVWDDIVNADAVKEALQEAGIDYSMVS